MAVLADVVETVPPLGLAGVDQVAEGLFLEGIEGRVCELVLQLDEFLEVIVPTILNSSGNPFIKVFWISPEVEDRMRDLMKNFGLGLFNNKSGGF